MTTTTPSRQPNREEQMKDIEHRFAYHAPPTVEIGQAHAEVRDACKQAALKIIELTPPSREQSLALTKLEEAMMHANGAIARNHGAVQKILDDRRDARERGLYNG